MIRHGLTDNSGSPQVGLRDETQQPQGLRWVAPGETQPTNDCGWVGDADVNGAKNIATLGVIVNNPGGSGMMSCSLRDVVGLLELRWHWIANDTKIRIGRTAVTPLQ
jgi:hypothetical protein